MSVLMAVLDALLTAVLVLGFVALLLLAISPKRSVALMHPKE